MRKLPQILQRSIVAKTAIFHIEQVHLRFANGNERFFERIISRGNGAVLIVPLLDEETILLVREYAAGVERYEIGFPKGMCDKDESILAAANRELMEETGYGARNFEILKTTTTSPGYWGNSATIILAKDLYPAQSEGDEPEPLEVIPWKINAIDKLIEREDFTEARSLLALFLVKEKVRTCVVIR